MLYSEFQIRAEFAKKIPKKPYSISEQNIWFFSLSYFRSEPAVPDSGSRVLERTKPRTRCQTLHAISIRKASKTVYMYAVHTFTTYIGK